MQGIVMLHSRARVTHRDRSYTSWTRVLAQNILGRPLLDNEIVHHADDDCSNDVHRNLVICTRAYHDGVLHKHTRAGGRPCHALTDADVKDIFSFSGIGWSQYDLADWFDVSQSYISRLINGHRR